MISIEKRAKGTLVLIGGKLTPGKTGGDKICQEIIQLAHGESIAIISIEPVSNHITTCLEHAGSENVRLFLMDRPEKANSTELCQQLEKFGVFFIPDNPNVNFFNIWKQTLLLETIRNAFYNGKIILAEGSGACFFGEISLFNKNGLVSPVNLFKNPFIQSLQLEENFIPLLPNALIDSDVTETGVFIKLLPLLARCAIQKSRLVNGVGIGQDAALVIDSNLTGRVIGTGQVCILCPTSKTQIRFEFPKSPECTELVFYQLSPGSKIELSQLNTDFHSTSTSEPEEKPKFSLPANPLFFFGKMNADINSWPANKVIIQRAKTLCREGGNLTILSSEQSHTSAIEFSNSLRFDCHSEIAAITLNDNRQEHEIHAEQIRKSTGIVLFGNNLSNMITYLRSPNSVAKAFRNRLNAGIPLGFVGSAIQLAGRWMVPNTPIENDTASEIPSIDGLNYLKSSILLPNLTATEQVDGKQLTQFFQIFNQKSAKLGILLDTESFIFLSERRNLVFGGTAPTILIDHTAFNNEEQSCENPKSLVHLVHDNYEFDLRKYELHPVTKGPANSI